LSSESISRVLYRLRGSSHLSRATVARGLVRTAVRIATNPGERAGSS